MSLFWWVTVALWGCFPHYMSFRPVVRPWYCSCARLNIGVSYQHPSDLVTALCDEPLQHIVVVPPATGSRYWSERTSCLALIPGTAVRRNTPCTIHITKTTGERHFLRAAAYLATESPSIREGTTGDRGSAPYPYPSYVKGNHFDIKCTDKMAASWGGGSIKEYQTRSLGRLPIPAEQIHLHFISLSPFDLRIFSSERSCPNWSVIGGGVTSVAQLRRRCNSSLYFAVERHSSSLICETQSNTRQDC